MIARARANQIEMLLVVLALVLAFLALNGVPRTDVSGFLQARSSGQAAQDAESQRVELVNEAGQYDINALLDTRDGLAAGEAGSALPTRADAEFKISQVAGLISVSGLELGPVFQNELSAVVANEDVGIAGEAPPPRTYPAIELSLQIDGEIGALLDLMAQLLDEVEGATFADMVVDQDAESGGASLTIRILFFHREG